MQEVARGGTQVEVHRQHVVLLEECWTSQEAAKARAQRMKDLAASAVLLEAGVASTSEAILQHSAEAGEADELVSQAVGRAAEMRSAGDETSAGVCNQEANKWRAAAAQARHEVQVTLSLQPIQLCAQNCYVSVKLSSQQQCIVSPQQVCHFWGSSTKNLGTRLLGRMF